MRIGVPLRAQVRLDGTGLSGLCGLVFTVSSSGRCQNLDICIIAYVDLRSHLASSGREQERK